MIQVSNVTYRYPRGSEIALQDVSVQVAEGETLAIVGPNGSGKSTLGRLMKGLIFPSSGAITVDGQDTRRGTLDVRRTVGLVFQNPTSQIVNAVVEQEVAFGPENLGLPPDEIRHRVDDALAAVRMAHLKESECNALSMANKQRVAIAAVIAMQPRYLILDEPTAWLEPVTRRPVLEEVFRWSAGRNVAVIIVTHRMDEAQMCRRVIGMLHGRVEVEGPATALLRDADVRSRLSLDIPEALELAETLHSHGLPVTPGASVERLADELAGAHE